VGGVIVAIEICDTRLADQKTASDLWKLADFQNNGALITGSGVARWQAIDWLRQRAELLVNGEPRIDVTGAHPFGDPFRLLPWIVAHCVRRCGGLRAGDIVTTGSWGGVHYVEPGCEVRARFAGIGEAAVTIRG
jgi:2-keto-4-pentenoate hydratase